MSTTPAVTNLEAFIGEQFDQLYERIRLLELRLNSTDTRPAPQTVAATTTTKPTRREKKKSSSQATQGTIPTSLHLSACTYHTEDKPDQQLLTVIVPDALAPHLVGKGGRGLKQIHDISGAHIRAFEVKEGSAGARHVSIRGTDSQVGEALVVLGKRIARMRVRAPRQRASKGPARGACHHAKAAESGSVPGPAARQAAPYTPPAWNPALKPKSTALTPAPPSASSTPRAGSTTPSVPSIIMQTAAPPSPVATPGARSASTTPRTQPNTPIVPSVTMQTANPTAAPSSTGSPMSIDALTARISAKASSLSPLASVPRTAPGRGPDSGGWRSTRSGGSSPGGNRGS